MYKFPRILAVVAFLLYASPALATNTLLLNPQLQTVQPVTTKIAPLDTTATTATDSGSTQISNTAAGTSSAQTVNQDLLKRSLAQKAIEARINEKKKENEDLATKIQSMFTEYWVQMLALVVSVIGVILAVSGFSLANNKKRKYLRKFLHEIDNIYASYKWKSRRCEAELYRLTDQIEEKLKAGQIDENTYHLLEARIQKYLDEIRDEMGKSVQHHDNAHGKEVHRSEAKKLADRIDGAGKDL